MTAQVIDFDFSVAQSLGLHVETVREAKPVLHELGLRFAEVMSDLVVDHSDVSREAFALAQAMTAAIIIDTVADTLEEDAETFYFRLIEAADRGLFDLTMAEASPRLKALFNQFQGDDDYED